MVSASNFLSEDKGTFKSFVSGFLPAEAAIPVRAECGDTELCVDVGDSVEEGQVIARSGSFCVHSSIPGEVVQISSEQYADGKQGLSVRVRLKGSFKFVGKSKRQFDWRFLDSDSLCELFLENGVVNTFNGCVSLYSQVKDSRAKILAVRLFDDDPSRVSESFVSETVYEKVVEGAAVIAKALGAGGVAFVYEKSNSAMKRIYGDFDVDGSETAERFSDLFKGVKVLSVPVDVKKYPSGTMRNIVSASKSAARSLSRKERDSYSLFSKFCLNDFFIDSQTAVGAFDAVVLRTPVMSRFVHVTGDSLNAAAILRVKIGTPLRQLVEQCGGLKKRLARIVVNGIVLGYSVGSLDIPVSKMVKSVEFIPENQTTEECTEMCIRCGSCRKVCPMRLWPGNIYRAFKLAEVGDSRNGGTEKAVLDSARLCIECGLCNSVCPSRLPLRQTIAFAKADLSESGAGNDSGMDNMPEYEI